MRATWGIVLLSACTGLSLTEGNAFPCTYELGPGARDQACAKGDVCAPNNLCTKYIYEGPRFEGVPSVPVFDGSAFAKLHPGAVDGPVQLLARRPTARTSGFLQIPDAGFQLNGRGQLSLARPLPPTFVDVHVLSFSLPNGSVDLLTGIEAGHLTYRVLSPGVAVVEQPGDDATHLRLTPLAGAVPLAQAVLPDGGAGDVTSRAVPPLPVKLELKVSPYVFAGPAVDVGALNRTTAGALLPTRVVLTPNSVLMEQRDGGFNPVTVFPRPTMTTLMFNHACTVMTVSGPRLLSTWQVGISDTLPRSHTLQPAWPDCTPCGAKEVIETALPLPPGEGLGVEVACRGPNGRTLLRVTGSDAVEPGDSCRATTFPMPFEDSALGADSTVFASSQRDLMLGGIHGEVWAGDSLSSLLPRNLERLPLDVTRVPVRTSTGVTTSLGVITDRYFAVLEPARGERPTSGFRRIDALEDLNRAAEVRLLSAIHGAPGWVVLSSGVVTQVNVDDGDPMPDAGPTVAFGPRLTTPSGAPITRSSGGEAWVDGNGKVGALFIAADDGLYVVASPDTQLGDRVTGQEELGPQLQPEPSVPIRSLALERTPLGTNFSTAQPRARGYLVTARNVYEWKLSGSPARWTSTPLELAGGEPKEVWFDRELSALGRVGYSDGRVLTLPGGYLLANPIPGEQGALVKLIDFDNFGGWPVALASNGLFAAGWNLVDGKLQNRFPDGSINRPMDWKELALADGTKPWMVEGQARGRLYVAENLGTNGQRVYRLYVFLENSVLRLAEYTR
jgi:hypothetical protein